MASPHCQKCRAPLKLDSSLQDLNPASFKILADAALVLEPKAPEAPRSAAARERRQQYDEVSKQAGPPLQKRSASGSQRTAPNMAPDMSFVMLSDSQFGPEGVEKVVQMPPGKKTGSKKGDPASDVEPTAPLSQKMETATRLFEILSARSDIDHPICVECTELVLDGLQKRQAGVVRERDAYVDFLKKAQDELPTDEEKEKTKHELDDARQRETAALNELEALESEKSKTEDEIAALDAEAEELDEEEEAFWRERNAFSAELYAFKEERDSLESQLAHDTQLLEALKRTNVYNDAFSINHDGKFGTINGLRLGRIPDHPVEWSEINAAWGQAVLLLAVVSEKLGYKFKEYKLVPVGSTSKIVKYDTRQQQPTSDGKQKGNVLELYNSGNLSLGLGLFHGKFDEAMVAFLDCVRLVAEHMRHSSPSGTSNIRLPYAINKDKIGDVSIRLGNFGQDEQWTQACKLTLTCCKFLLAHASHAESRNASQDVS